MLPGRTIRDSDWPEPLRETVNKVCEQWHPQLENVSRCFCKVGWFSVEILSSRKKTKQDLRYICRGIRTNVKIDNQSAEVATCVSNEKETNSAAGITVLKGNSRVSSCHDRDKIFSYGANGQGEVAPPLWNDVALLPQQAQQQVLGMLGPVVDPGAVEPSGDIVLQHRHSSSTDRGSVAAESCSSS